MAIEKLNVENFTVFKDLEIEFSKGINILIGKNGTGKTHLMKILYSACEAASPSVSFSEKLVKVFNADNYSINRLITKGQENKNTKIRVQSNLVSISMEFSEKTNKWDATVNDENIWESKHDSKIISTFIPVEEMLSHSYKFEAAQSKGNVDFDETYVDIIRAAKLDISTKDSFSKVKYLDELQKVLEGKVTLSENEKFYLIEKSALIEFSLVAEGIKKLALLWLLIKNGALENGSILFWDEPEANINPSALPILVDILLKLQRDGVQIFLATHNYNLAKYLEVKKEKNDNVLFHNFDKIKGEIVYNKSEIYKDIKDNSIETANEELFNAVIEKSVEDIENE